MQRYYFHTVLPSKTWYFRVILIFIHVCGVFN
nr:MAG TPA: hypothetical protein [Caudoviricetes sp.]